mmetsp:Transcript_75397/g.228494  ORF Transcript_75397/g.228494 Transcript_75397/m.228494 type:complete len:308 (-) Transcript_75397:70-993(-)
MVRARAALLVPLALLSRGAVALRAGPQPAALVRERGYHGHESCESPILVKPGTDRSFLLCVPYKNGWEWWSRTVCDAEGHGHACREGYRKRTQALDYLWWRHSDEEIQELYKLASLPKLKLVRNPLTRVLAAWLTWVTQAQPGSYNYVEASFGDFVRGSMVQRPNCHWSRQPRHCGEDEGVPWEVLKVEERDVWGPAVLQRLGLASAAGTNGGIQTQQRQACPGHRCSAMPLMTKYYTPELMRLVRAHYAEEIARYNYTEALDRWQDAIEWGFEDSPRTFRRQHLSMLQLRLDLEALEAGPAGVPVP